MILKPINAKQYFFIRLQQNFRKHNVLSLSCHLAVHEILNTLYSGCP